MIRYLKQQEKERCRLLWEEAFPEESKSFNDYYFQEKMKDNRVLVREIDGAIASVVHQNPYEVMLGDVSCNVDYIVGVATDRTKRKQGHMRALLCYMLKEMYGEGMPFCFLMPADENIYLPFDFAYVFQQPQWRLRADSGVEIRKGVPGDLDDTLRRELSFWINNWLARNYQVYCVRDEEYLKRLELELKSEEGDLFLLYQDGRICGVQSFIGLCEREQRFLLCDETFREDAADAKPAIMARIVNLESFMKGIHLKKGAGEAALEIWIRIEDKLVSANDGVFRWTVNQYGSSVIRQEGQAQLTLSISQLTQWLFGYRDLEDLLGSHTDIPDVCMRIQVLDGVFLDEVV